MAASHHVQIGNGWALWRWIFLRSAGFPAKRVLTLGSDEIHDAVQQWHQCRQALARATNDALASCQAHAESPQASAAVTHLKAGRLLKRDVGIPEIDRHLQAMRDTTASVATSYETALAVIDASYPLLAENLKNFASDPLFREALIWQNRSVVRPVLDTYLATTVDSNNAKTRERKRLLGKYAQRYSVKNDSIGFFGPVGWFDFDPDIPGFELTPGPLIDTRQIYFEHWMLEEFATSLSFEDEALPAMHLRLKPFAWIESGTLLRPPAAPIRLTESENDLLTLGTSLHTVRDIVRECVSSRAKAYPNEQDVLESIRDLVKKGYASCKIEIPTETANPEGYLRSVLENLSEGDFRDRAIANLDTLERCLKDIGNAAGNPSAMEPAIETLEAEFMAITGTEAKRGHGKVYAGRLIFYEECRRGGRLRAGQVLIREIERTLPPILQSARWFTYQVGRRYQREFTKTFKALCEKSGSIEVPIGAFLVGTGHLFAHANNDKAPIVEEVQNELMRRWSKILDLDRKAQSVKIETASISKMVEQAFAAPCPGWPRARYQAPDMMIAASSAKNISEGDFLLVLGELHAGVNTMLGKFAYVMHPTPEDIVAACMADHEQPNVAPVQVTADRVSVSNVSPNDYHVELGTVPSWRTADRTLVGGDLFMIEQDGRLYVRSRSKELSIDIMRFMDHYISAEASPHFRILPKSDHSPRVTLDKTVISRERWSFRRTEFAELVSQEAKRKPQTRFLSVASWAKERDLPRFVFATVPHEAKPFYIDFASPLFVEILLRYLDKAGSVALSEMLPNCDQQWLESDSGEFFTAELRLTTVDPKHWAPY